MIINKGDMMMSWVLVEMKKTRNVDNGVEWFSNKDFIREEFATREEAIKRGKALNKQLPLPRARDNIEYTTLWNSLPAGTVILRSVEYKGIGGSVV